MKLLDRSEINTENGNINAKKYKKKTLSRQFLLPIKTSVIVKGKFIKFLY